MPRIQPPEIYVVAIADEEARTNWFGDLLRICLKIVEDSWTVEIIDEKCANAAGDVAGTAFKISRALSEEALRRLFDELRSVSGARVQLIRAVIPNETVLGPSDYSVEYFRNEFAVDSPMIFQTDCCAMLRHLSSGKIARSTAHRSRAMNVEEALLLLEALVANNMYVA